MIAAYLHELAMAVINEDAQDKAGELFDMLEAGKRLHDTLSALAELRPESLDDEGRDDADED